jgi:cell division protein FtsB
MPELSPRGRRADLARGPQPWNRPRRRAAMPLLSRTIIWGTAAICVALLIGTLGEAWFGYQMNQRVAAQTAANARLQAQNAQLAAQATRLAQPDVIEAEARQRFAYIRPGDYPVIVIPIANTPALRLRSHSTPPAPQNYWGSWWQALFGG